MMTPEMADQQRTELRENSQTAYQREIAESLNSIKNTINYMKRILVMFVFAASLAQAQPTIKAIVNAASGYNYYGAGPSTWYSIYGTGLSIVTASWSTFTDGQMPTSLDGVSVTLVGWSFNAAGTAAINVSVSGYVDYVSPTQVNFVSPANMVALYSNIQISNSAGTACYNGGIGTPGACPPPAGGEAKNYPALFTFGSFTVPFDGSEVFGVCGFAPCALPYVLAQHAHDYSLVTASNPARIGENIILYGTGMGSTTTSVTNGSIDESGELGNFPIITISSLSGATTTAVVSWAGLISPGLYQINMVVPTTYGLLPGQFGNLPTGPVAIAPNVGVNTADELIPATDAMSPAILPLCNLSSPNCACPYPTNCQ
jgi:uncharacterized protein (TIGR03437 family)